MVGLLHKLKKSLNKTIKIKPTQAVVLGFAAVILAGAVLLTLPAASRSGQSAGFVTALFTSTSAVCVTGLVVVDTYLHWTIFGQIVILTLIQIGGLGFMTMATLFSLVLRRRISITERLVMAESLNQYNLQGIVALTQKILLSTLLFESTGAVLLSLRFVPRFGLAEGIYNGIFHSVSAFCNAGFDLMGRYGAFVSLTGFVQDPIVSLVVMSLIVCGGLGFAVWSDIVSVHCFRKLHLHSKLVLLMTGILLLSGFVFFYTVEYGNSKTLGPLSAGGKLLAAGFQSVTPRTAGFNTIDLAHMRPASVVMTILLMFIGGSPGSTAGGIKTTTLGVAIFAVIAVIRGREDTELFKKRLSHSVVMRAFALIFISVALVTVVVIILSVAERAPLSEVLFETTSAFGTVGLTLGLTPKLHLVSRLAIIITMYLGRVGVLTMLLALASRSHSSPVVYRYREDKVAVG